MLLIATTHIRNHQKMAMDYMEVSVYSCNQPSNTLVNHLDITIYTLKQSVGIKVNSVFYLEYLSHFYAR